MNIQSTSVRLSRILLLSSGLLAIALPAGAVTINTTITGTAGDAGINGVSVTPPESGGIGGDGSIAYTASSGGSFDFQSGSVISGGAGGLGGNGVNSSSYEYYGGRGGNGGNGGDSLAADASTSVHIYAGTFTGGLGGLGGLGGHGNAEDGVYISAGGNGGNGGSAISLSSGSLNIYAGAFLGGAGGNGGNSRELLSESDGGNGGNGGNGGSAISLSSGSLNIYAGTFLGGAGGKLGDVDSSFSSNYSVSGNSGHGVSITGGTANIYGGSFAGPTVNYNLTDVGRLDVVNPLGAAGAGLYLNGGTANIYGGSFANSTFSGSGYGSSDTEYGIRIVDGVVTFYAQDYTLSNVGNLYDLSITYGDSTTASYQIYAPSTSNFAFVAVPEPATWTLLAIGGLVFGALALRRRNRA